MNFPFIYFNEAVPWSLIGVELFPGTLPVKTTHTLNTVILCCCCLHSCCCCYCQFAITDVVVAIVAVAFTAAGADVAETHKVVSSQHVNQAVCHTECLRGRMVIQLAQRLCLNTDNCNWSVPICSTSPPPSCWQSMIAQWSALAEG